MSDRDTIAQAVRVHLNQIGKTEYITDEVVVNRINAAQKRVNDDSGYYRADATVSTRLGTQEVTLPTSVLEVHEARIGTGSARVRLYPTSRGKLFEDNGNWEGQTAGTPTHYYLDGPVMGFYPQPVARDTHATSTAYATSAIVRPYTTDNGFTYIALNSGTSDTTEPVWPTTLSGTVTDNDIVWQQLAHTRVYIRCLKDPDDLANGTSQPTWCPRRYHETIAKAAAIDIAGGFDAEGGGNETRLQKLYQEYLREVADMRRLAAHRSTEYTPRVKPSGYSTYRR